MSMLLAEVNEICLMKRGEVENCFECPKYGHECMKTRMLIVCMDCNMQIGVKDGLGKSGITHGLCESCFKEKNKGGQ